MNTRTTIGLVALLAFTAPAFAQLTHTRLPAWPKLNVSDRQIMELGEQARPVPVLAPNRIEVFEQFTRSGGQLGLF